MRANTTTASLLLEGRLSAAMCNKLRPLESLRPMWIYLLQGIGFGMAAASQPGPFQTYLITQSLTNGWRRTLPASLAPLISDGPIIALCLLVLSQVPAAMERALYTLSGVFILYLAFGSYRSWRNYRAGSRTDSGARQSVWKAALMNSLSPGPYIFWTLITGPILIAGWRESPAYGVAFLAGFYVTIAGGLAGIILVFGLAARFGPRVNRTMLGISTIALVLFGFFQITKGLA